MITCLDSVKSVN